MNLYLVQISSTPEYVKYFYLPYSAGCLWAYASTNQTIVENYNLVDFIFLREDLDNAVNKLDNPKVLALSTYVWNMNYSLQLAKKVKEKFKDCLIIFGGPAVPHNSEKFLRKHQYIDLAVHHEGEYTFKKILLENIKSNPNFHIENVSFVKDDTYYKGSFSRILNLDELPSPYTSGIFDKYLLDPDITLNMIIETNRGCPYSCTFCDWGQLTTQKIKKFGLQRVFEEIEWAGKNKITFLFIADANFGIFLERDGAIVEKIVQTKKETGWPEIISNSWTKNMKTGTIELAKKLYDAGCFKKFTASIQTTTESSLDAIKRKNADGSVFGDILYTAKDYGFPVSTELIIGLPEETYSSYIDTLDFVYENNISYLYSILQVLTNSEMGQKKYIEKYGMKVIKTESSFSDEHSKEYELISVGTNTLPIDDYEKLLLFQWFIHSFHDNHLTHIFANAISKMYNIKITKFYQDLLSYILCNKNHILHSDFKELEHPVRNNLVPVLDTYPKNRTKKLLEKVFNKKDFYNDLKQFCMLNYNCDIDLLDDMEILQVNSYRYTDKDIRVNFHLNSNLLEYLENDDQLIMKSKRYVSVKDKIPYATDWYRFFISTAWNDFWKAKIYEV